MATLTSIVKSIYESCEEALKNKRISLKIRETDGESRWKLELEHIKQWNDSMCTLIENDYADFEICQLQMIILGSVDYVHSTLVETAFNDRVIAEAENLLVPIENALKLSSRSKSATQYDYSCQYSKQHTLFLNVCLSDELESWTNVACTVKFVNDVLEEAKRLKTRVAILDMRFEAHIHKDDLQQEQQNDDASSGQNRSSLCQVDNYFIILPVQKQYHHFVEKGITRKSAVFEQKLEELRNCNYEIAHLYMRCCDVTNAQLSGLESSQSSSHSSEQGDNIFYSEDTLKKDKTHHDNLAKCLKFLLEFKEMRLKKTQEERTFVTLRLLLLLKLKHSWHVKHIKFEKDTDDFCQWNSQHGFKCSKIDSNLYLKRQDDYFVFVLVSQDTDGQNALVFSKRKRHMNDFLRKHIDKIVAINPAHSFQFYGITIQYDETKKCFYLDQAKTISILIVKHKVAIETIYKDRNGGELKKLIDQKKPINGSIDILDYKDYEKLSPELSERTLELLDNLMDIARKTRPDIYGDVALLLNYRHKADSKQLYIFATDILRYLYAKKADNKEDFLMIRPDPLMVAMSDGAGVKDELRLKDQAKNKQNQNKQKNKSNVQKIHSNNNPGNSGTNESITEPIPKNKPEPLMGVMSSALVRIKNSSSDDQSEPQNKKKPNPKKPQTGYEIRYYNSPVSYFSEAQDLNLANLSNNLIHNIEFIGAACTAVEVCIIKDLLAELGIAHNEPVQLYVDNETVLEMLDNMLAKFDEDNVHHLTMRVYSDREKKQFTIEELQHLDPYVHTMLYLLDQNVITIDYVRSANNLSDVYTKDANKSFDAIKDSQRIVRRERHKQ